MRALQVEFTKCGVCVDFHHEGGISRGEWDLHRLREVGLVPGGRLSKPRGWPTKPRGRAAEWSNFHRLSGLSSISGAEEGWNDCYPQ
jgi:hypothetical protein